jgi:hypothetical protein
MKNYVFFLALIIISACSAIKKPAAEAMQNDTASLRNLSFSFYSRGSGPDNKARQTFDDFLNKFESSNQVKLAYDKVSWGREGEYDLCFGLSELSPELASEFAKGAKQTLDGKQVRIKENSDCKK